jgi:hypothetical protein
MSSVFLNVFARGVYGPKPPEESFVDPKLKQDI